MTSLYADNQLIKLMAEFCHADKLWLDIPNRGIGYLDDEGKVWDAPNYLDLNLIHKLEEQYLTIDHCDMYDHYLWNICHADSQRRGYRATARQRLLALLMTFNRIPLYKI